MRKATPRPDYEALLAQVRAGTLTRVEAATASGTPKSFLGWVHAHGHHLPLPDQRTSEKHWNAHTDPHKVQAYEKALELALSGRVSVRSAAAAHGVSYVYLLRKFHKAVGSMPPQPAIDEDEVFRAINDETARRLQAALRVPE